MQTRTGIVTFHRRSPKGLWYSLFVPGEGKVDLFSRRDAFLLFDRVEATFSRRCDSCFLSDWTLVERSPLADRPGLLAAAGYFGHLINCFTEGGASESEFVETARQLLETPLTTDTLTTAEQLWAHAMGLRTDDRIPVGGIIREHIGSGYRIREHLVTDLSLQEERHA
ncbi:MAG TPA: hypothetical protein PLV42_04530 [bacterium]|nr:hypothetical protein [bacterium]